MFTKPRNVMNENERTYAGHLINRTIPFGIQSKLNKNSDVVLNTINLQSVHTDTFLNHRSSNQAMVYTNYVQYIKFENHETYTFQENLAQIYAEASHIPRQTDNQV